MAYHQRTVSWFPGKLMDDISFFSSIFTIKSWIEEQSWWIVVPLMICIIYDLILYQEGKAKQTRNDNSSHQNCANKI